MTGRQRRPEVTPSASPGRTLRQRAEDLARGNAVQPPRVPVAASSEEARQALEELRVHQFELEMQNEELLRAQAELDVARARYFDLYDLAPVGYCTLSENGLVLELNLTAANLLGVARGALIRQPITRVIHSEDQNIYYLHLRRLFKDETPQTFELRMVRADGTAFWMQLVAIAARDAGDVPICRVALSDVTERKSADEALRGAHWRLEGVIEGTHVGTWEWNVQTGETVFNEMWAQIVGHTLDDLGPISIQTWESLVHPADQARSGELLERHFAGELPYYDCECRMRHKDGRWIWVHDRGRVITRTGDGKPLMMFGTHTDITERRSAESEFRKLSNAVEQSPVSIVITNVAGDIEYVNPKFIELTGYTRAEALGQNPRVLKSGDRSPEHYRELWEAITAGKDWHGDFHNRKKNGELYWERASISAIRDPDGHITHFLAVKEDITERKRAEEALLETNRVLEEITARANDLAAQANTASRAKSEFLANMSHEIRTPMNGVIGMTGLLLDTELSAEQRKYAGIVRTSGEALLGLINDILDFSKIEAGKLELEVLDFELRTTLEDVADLLAVKAHEKGLDVVCLADPELPALLRGDPGRLRQILLNLGGNAVKFTERGGVTIRASVAAEDEQRVTVRFAVTDTGIGIPREKQGALFSPFTQVDGSATRKYGGTGLGLAISRQLSELMGGAIGMESGENQGSTFWFTAVLEKRPAAELSVATPLADLAGVRVLVVDDLDTNALLVTTLLKGWGCRFATAADGEAALDQLREALRAGDPFGVALLDNLMPDMDGVELGRRIKESPELRGTRLVMMTSHGERGDAARITRLGFAGYLTKPLRQSQLRECLALVLGRGDSATAMPALGLVTRHTMAEARQHRVRILVADDNPTNQIVALKILEKLGYRADVVANGREALVALRDIPYDLVLMDCQMPELDGFETTREIRAPGSQVRDHQVPIIAMTANVMKGDREKCLAAGMDDYVGKPVRPAELAAALERRLTARDPLAVPGAERAVPTVPQAEAPVFDREAFLERLMGDEEMVREITEMFLADLPVQFEGLAAAVGSGDCGLAGQLAHGIKGASANVGGEALRETAFEMETAGKAGDLAALKDLLPEARDRFARLKEAMEKDAEPGEKWSCAS